MIGVGSASLSAVALLQARCRRLALWALLQIFRPRGRQCLVDLRRLRRLFFVGDTFLRFAVRASPKRVLFGGARGSFESGRSCRLAVWRRLFVVEFRKKCGALLQWGSFASSASL